MWIYDFNYVCAIVHTFAKMYGAFDVILSVNPTFDLLINLLIIFLSYLLAFSPCLRETFLHCCSCHSFLPRVSSQMTKQPAKSLAFSLICSYALCQDISYGNEE